MPTGFTPRARIVSWSTKPTDTTRCGSLGIVVEPYLWSIVTGNAAAAVVAAGAAAVAAVVPGVSPAVSGGSAASSLPHAASAMPATASTARNRRDNFMGPPQSNVQQP